MIPRFFIFVFLLFFSFNNLEAATLYLDPGVTTLNRSDAITMAVRIMPDKETGECINTVDAVINYSDGIQPVDVSIGRSIFNVWVEQPTINKEDNKITFAGGITNGYCGRVQGDPRLTNVIAEIIFRSPGFQIGGGNSDTDEATIDFAPETQAYINDGQGTKAQLKTLGSRITLEKTAGASIIDDWREAVQADDLPPEEFSITLTKDKVAFSGKYFIVFDTTDKQTGVSHYEVMEEEGGVLDSFAWGEADAPWIQTTSPYVLKDQTLRSTVRVKAIDKAGNEYIATLAPDGEFEEAQKSEPLNYILFASIFIFVVVIGVAIFYVYKRRKRKTVDSQNFIHSEVEEEDYDDYDDENNN